MGSLIGIIVLVLGVILVFRIIGSLIQGASGGYGGPNRMGGPGFGGPGYGGPGYGGPGYGYGGGGGGGGGFWSSMFGGIGGAMAGNWLYDQFSGRRHGYYDANPTSYDPGSVPTQDDGGTGWESSGAADWGGGDTAGGDWGGGGGDTGGGDWGGGGGGDWGGGGGDNGGSW